MPIQLSQRALNTPPSPIRSLVKYSREAEEKGKLVHYLNIGQPDVQTPQEFFEGLRLYQKDVLAYESSEGNLELRETWIKFFNKTTGLNLTKKNLLITTGASEALVFLFMICCDPGDEVIIMDPTYANYMGFAAISGVNLVPVETYLEDSFAIPSIDTIKSKITSKTHAVLLCNPNNPTGTVYSQEELESIIQLCEERNLFLIVDETYREIVFNGAKPLSILSLAPENPRVIVVDSLSKMFSLCGARIGGVFTHNEEVYQQILNLAQARLASPTLEQFAANHMLNSISENYVSEVKKKYENRQNTLYDALIEIEGVELCRPQGAFYSVVKLPIDSSKSFIKFLLREFDLDGETVFLAPADGFFMTPGRGKAKVRIAAVLEEEKLQRAVEIINQALKQYN